MKTSTKFLAAVAALALGTGGLVFAQAGQGPYGSMGGGMGMQHAGMGVNGGGLSGMRGAGAMADPTAQLAAAKAELKITAAQEGAWQAYEGVVRQQAISRQATRTAMQSRMQDPNAAATFDPAAQRESMRKLRESHQAALNTARQTLFAALTPEQRALAERQLLNVPGSGPGVHMHRHAG